MKALSKWIEVTGHFNHDTDGEFVFDCELPEDAQEILVTLNGGYVNRDICRIDASGYHLESGWDWDEDILRWAPMPPAWWEENTHSRKGVFIPYITVEMFRNAPLKGVEELMASGEMEDISLPSAQPERKRGEWNRYYRMHSGDTFVCNRCGSCFVVLQGEDKMNLCPNCGADMRGEQG